MAKQVQPLEIILGIKGAEKLAALKSSFRDLTKTVKQSDADIESARKSINDYVKSANNSEAVIEGQIKAFEGLRKQAAMGGKVYLELSNDITDLKAQLNGSTSAIDAHRKSLLETAGSAKVTQSQLLSVANALSALQKQTALGSKAFVELGADIASLEGKIAKVKTEQEELNKLNLAANQAATGGAAATRLQIKAINEKVAAIRDEKRATEELSKQSRIRLGMQKLLDRPGDVPFRSREYIEQAVASGLLGENITKMFGAKELQTAIDVVRQSVAELQNEIETELGNSARRAFQEMAREGRESARSLAIAFSGPEFERIFSNLEKNVGKLPNTTAGLSQRLRELERVLNNTARGGDNYVAVALEIARVQREASAATQGLGAALVNDLASGVAVRSQKNLREAIGQLQAEMSELNTETAEGSAKYAENARQVNRLQKELDGIANSYRTVADVARQAGMAMGGSLNPFTVAGGRRRATPDFSAYEQPIGPEISPAARQAAEDRKQEIRDRIANLKKINTENDALREQNAIRRSIAKNREKVAARAGIDRPMREISGLYKGIADIGMSKIAADIDRMGNSYYQVANDIKNATKASNGSINSLQAQRNAWASLRAGLDPTSKAYQDVGREIEKVDRRLEKLNRSRRRMSSMQMTQAAGAAISGGIFGGPEGFLGGVGGALVGGVGGAFAGAAFGAQVGGFRRQIGQYTEMAAEIQRLRLGLAGASNDFADFIKASQAAGQASERLLIPLADSYRIMTQLRANTVELGISVDDTQKIFEGIAASIYKTGGGLAEVQGAMRAVIQVLSKGAPQAEELRGQLGERLPAAIIDFAKFTKRTPEELAKAFEDSKVTLEEFVDFAKNKFDENGEYLDELGDNAAYAGMRYQKALERVQLTTGTAFQAAGANLQDFATFWLNRFDEMINKALELGIVQPGENYFVQQVLDQKITIEELETKILRLAQAYKELKKFSFDVFGIRVGAPAVKRTRQELEAAENALKRLRRLEEQTRERKKQDEQDRKDQKEKQRATSLLNAIEQRENAIAQARIQLEEQAANIRKQAIEQARQLEQRFADQRLQKERELQDLRRQLAYVEEDIALSVAESQFVAAGGDPEIARIRREAVEFERKQKEEEIELERQFLDEQTETSKAIEEFKSSNAKAIMEANGQHTKRMGEIQREYARNVAKIVEEGADRAGKRLEIAGAIAAAQIKKGMAESLLGDLGVFINQKGEPKLFPGVTLDSGAQRLVSEQKYLYDEASKEIQQLTEKLSQVPTATAIAAPPIDRISINVDNLTSSLRKNAAAFDEQNEKIKRLKESFTGGTEVQRLVSAAADISTGLAEQRQRLERDQAISRGVLRLREEGYSDGTARSLMEQELDAAQLLARIQELRKQAESAAASQEQRVNVGAAFDAIKQSTESWANAVRDLTIALDNIPTEIKLREAVVDLKQQLKDLVDPANQIKGAAMAIGDAFAQSFVDAISGAKTAKEALADFFQSVGSYFLDMAKQIIAQMIQIAILNSVAKLLPGLGSGGGPLGNGQQANPLGRIMGPNPLMPGRANGGPVTGGSPYIVGERGPELFVPGRAGMIVPNNNINSGGKIIVNVDASGSRVQGDNGGAQKLGNAIAAAVQTELIKQKRPGGLLA